MAGSKVFQIVGYQNSGKTTLLQKMILGGTSRGLRIGTIKHHGHGGKPDKSVSDKDSDKHRNSGAMITSVEGDGTLLIEATKQYWSVEEIVLAYESFSLDLILIEGYKKASYPKVVMIRNEEDLSLLEELENIHTIISWIPLAARNVYFIHSMDQFVEAFYNDINKGLG